VNKRISIAAGIALTLFCLSWLIFQNITARMEIFYVYDTITVIINTEKVAAKAFLKDEEEFKELVIYIEGYYPDDTRIKDKKLIEMQELVRAQSLDRLAKMRQ
jgi:hypothetical protein